MSCQAPSEVSASPSRELPKASKAGSKASDVVLSGAEFVLTRCSDTSIRVQQCRLSCTPNMQNLVVNSVQGENAVILWRASLSDLTSVRGGTEHKGAGKLEERRCFTIAAGASWIELRASQQKQRERWLGFLCQLWRRAIDSPEKTALRRNLLEHANSFAIDSGESSEDYNELLHAVGLAQDAGLDAEHDEVLTLAMSKIVAAQIYTQLQHAIDSEDEDSLSTLISIAEHKRLDMQEDDKASLEDLLERAKRHRLSVGLEHLYKAIERAQNNVPSHGLDEAVSRVLVLEPALHDDRVRDAVEAAALAYKHLDSHPCIGTSRIDSMLLDKPHNKYALERTSSDDWVLRENVLTNLRALEQNPISCNIERLQSLLEQARSLGLESVPHVQHMRCVCRLLQSRDQQRRFSDEISRRLVQNSSDVDESLTYSDDNELLKETFLSSDESTTSVDNTPPRSVSSFSFASTRHSRASSSSSITQTLEQPLVQYSDAAPRAKSTHFNEVRRQIAELRATQQESVAKLRERLIVLQKELIKQAPTESVEHLSKPSHPLNWKLVLCIWLCILLFILLLPLLLLAFRNHQVALGTLFYIPS